MSPKEVAGLEILITGGDWAAALHDAGVLADVCRALWAQVTTPIQIELVDIAKQCHRDLDDAIRRWAVVSAHMKSLLLVKPGSTCDLRVKA